MSQHQKNLKIMGFVFLMDVLINIGDIVALLTGDIEYFRPMGVGVDVSALAEVGGVSVSDMSTMLAVCIAVIAVIHGIFGMLCVRGANVPSKVGPVVIFGAVLCALSVYGFVSSIVSGVTDFWALFSSFALAVASGYAAYEANCIKKESTR